MLTRSGQELNSLDELVEYYKTHKDGLEVRITRTHTLFLSCHTARSPLPRGRPLSPHLTVQGKTKSKSQRLPARAQRVDTSAARPHKHRPGPFCTRCCCCTAARPSTRPSCRPRATSTSCTERATATGGRRCRPTTMTTRTQRTFSTKVRPRKRRKERRVEKEKTRQGLGPLQLQCALPRLSPPSHPPSPPHILTPPDPLEGGRG